MSDLALTAAGRLDAATPAARLHQVARQFEGVFLRELMKPLEDEEGLDGGGLLDGGSPGRQYRQLLHGALAEQAAGGLGVAAMLERSLALRPAGGPGPAPGTAP